MWNARVVDLFCGAGGLTCGLESAGLVVAEGVDVDKRCRHPYEKHTSARFVNKDILEYKSEDIRNAWRDAKYKILVGCAPCQPYSTDSKKKKTNEHNRWSLISRFETLVVETRPDVVSMENVPPLRHRHEYLEFKSRLQEMGYFVHDVVADCRLYGVPQKRDRLVLLASRHGSISIVRGSTLDSESWPDVKSAIGHLPSLNAGDVYSNDPLHRTSRLSEVNLRRIRVSIPGGTWRDWPVSLRAPCHQREKGRTYPSVYGRMEWKKPSPTITGQCYGYGNGRFGHPDQDRALSLREAAILQTFPLVSTSG